LAAGNVLLGTVLLRAAGRESDRSMPTRRSVLTGFGMAATAGACAPLSLLNAVSFDNGAELVGQDVAYGEDARQRLDVYAPAQGSKPAPVVVFFYGGSWNSGSKAEYGFAASAIAARGYITVLPDYRLVPQVRFPSFLDDGAHAIAWVERNIGRYGGDNGKVFVAGHSAGAYNAVMIALDRRYGERAGLRPRLLKGVAGLSGPYDFLPLDTKATIDAFALAPRLTETQPIALVRPGLPPFFLATGADDDLVFPRNTRALAGKLKAAGGAVEEKVYPGLGHAGTLLALSVPFRGKAPVLDDMVAFFRRTGA
jgi:acetyl esterase/lipase